MGEMVTPILEARKIVKRFPGVVALKGVSFDLRPGEIHALCGENGAGKSTLIKILSGLHACGSYEGELVLHGRPLALEGVAAAERQGIAVICQELALVPQMTVAENISLGREPRRLGMIDWPAVQARAGRLLKQFAVDLSPGACLAGLGVGQQQLVEIVKALSKESRILILDEPTAALAEHEVRVLLRILGDLRQRGVSLIYISHKLDEVLAIADRITVLRDGQSITTVAAKATTKAELIRHMVGREITDLYPRREAGRGQPMLEVEGLSVRHPQQGGLRLKGISFRVHAGEVLGLGGLMGAGRTELLMHLFGAWGRRVAGEVRLKGQPLPDPTPPQAIRRGLVLVTEDRRRYGLHLDQSVGFNLALSSLGRISHAWMIDQAHEHQRNREISQALRVKAAGLDIRVGTLSGGNQQKVVLGKVLLTEPAVVFLDEPTRGIDVGAKVEIYELINRLTQQGQAVVLVSSELPELMGMSDRILMLHEGMIGGEFTRAQATQETLMAAAMGENKGQGARG